MDCCDVVCLLSHPGCSCGDHYLQLVEVFMGVNLVHSVPLAQALEKWPNLAFALEFAIASLSCEENL